MRVPSLGSSRGQKRALLFPAAVKRKQVKHQRLRCYTSGMPTTRKRHIITESDAVAAALDHAALRWPEDAGNRARLLLRLVEEGHHAVAAQREDEVSRRREALAETSGCLTGMFGPGYLEELRRDWPE